MHVEQLEWFSPILQQNLALTRYGHAGQPFVVFPSSRGRYFDFANNGMVDTVRPYLESGQTQLICVDSIDKQTWHNTDVHPLHRGHRHNQYAEYIFNEVVPLVREFDARKPITTGCSMGAFHATNFFFRRPDLFGGVLSMSGLFQMSRFLGNYIDDGVYFNSPLLYLPNLHDSWYLDQYRQSKIQVVVGQGRWEDDMRVDADLLRTILHHKSVPAAIDFWGYDVDHDWPWWRVQFPHYVPQFLG